jgi:hypothetical protein
MVRLSLLVPAVLAALALQLALEFAPASADPADAAATSAYLSANYAFVRSADAATKRVESTLHALPGRVAHECGNAAAGSPEDTDSEQLSNELIGELVITADRLDLGAATSYLKAVRTLRWSDAALTATIRSYASQVSRLRTLAPPHLCADVRSWTASGFKTLPPSTVAFDSAFLGDWVAPGDLPAALGRYETSSERGLVARTVQVEYEIAELETREEQTWWDAMDELQLWP